MAERGLTAPVQQGAAQVVGDTLGMLGPAIGTQFAPQIAGSLNRGAANFASPRTLNRQAGAVYVGKQKIAGNAYHGTGDAAFSRFNPEMIGARNADVGDAFWLTDDFGHARGYARQATGRKVGVNVKEANVFYRNPMVVDAMDSAQKFAQEWGAPDPQDWEEASELLRYSDWLRDQIASAMKMGKDGLIVKNTGDAPFTAGGLATHFAVFNPRRVRFLQQTEPTGLMGSR
jgi:hypothetical protein